MLHVIRVCCDCDEIAIVFDIKQLWSNGRTKLSSSLEVSLSGCQVMSCMATSQCYSIADIQMLQDFLRSHWLFCIRKSVHWNLTKIQGGKRNLETSSMHHFVAISEFKLELQSGNGQFGSKSTIYFSRVTLQFDVWPCKTIGHLFYATSSFVHHFVAIGDFKLELQSRNAQFGSNSTIFRAVWPCNLMYDLEKQ